MKIKLPLRQKAVCATLVIALVLAATAVFVSYRIYSDTMDDHYRTLTMSVAKTAASMVNTSEVKEATDKVKKIYLQHPSPTFSDSREEQAYLDQYNGVKDPGYVELFDTLQKIKADNGVLSLYIVYMDEASKSCVYVVDADTSEDACPPGTWDVIYDHNYQALKGPDKELPAYITDTREFGWLCSAGAPILDGNGNVIAHAMVDISMAKVVQDRHSYLARLCLILLAVTAILILIFIRVVEQVLIKPVNRLAQAAASYISEKEQPEKEGGQSALSRLSIHTGDEVENLCNAIKQMEVDINTYIDNLTCVTAEKERIGAELSVATHIQASMLPCIFPAFPDRPEFDIYATMTPAKEVGGDFYDFFLIDPDHLAVVIADVSGKGVPAALFMVIAKTLIKDHAQAGAAPEAVFTEVNRQLCETNDEGLFVTAWMGVLEISTGHLTFVNAGHNPPLVRQGNGAFTWLRTKPGFVLAGMEGIRYRSQTMDLAPGDMLYLYTDGVTEATDAQNTLYGDPRLKEVLDAHREEPPGDLLAAVKRDIDAFVGEAPQFDDITMLGLKLRMIKEEL